MSQKLERLHRYMDKYADLVWKHARHHVYQCWVDDVMQETFIKLYEHLDYLPDPKVKPWLLITAANIAKDYSRKGGKFESISLNDEELQESLEVLTYTIDSTLNQKAACELLQTALEILYEKNPIWYYVLADSCMLGMSSIEISKVLNISRTNVDVIKKRARKFLHKELGKEYEEIFN